MQRMLSSRNYFFLKKMLLSNERAVKDVVFQLDVKAFGDPFTVNLSVKQWWYK